MEDNNLLAEIQQDYQIAKNPKLRAKMERAKARKEAKEAKKNAKKFSFKRWAYKWLSIGTVSIVLTGALFVKGAMVVKNFNNSSEIKTRPFEVKIQTPAIWVEPRKAEVVYAYARTGESVEEARKEQEEMVKNTKNPEVAKKILNKFGDQGPLALAIASAESGLAYDALGTNEDRSVDVGVFQINYKRHKSKPECSLDKISTTEGNIDCAYTIFKAQGNFTAWSAYKNGTYLTFLDSNLK